MMNFTGKKTPASHHLLTWMTNESCCLQCHIKSDVS